MEIVENIKLAHDDCPAETVFPIRVPKKFQTAPACSSWLSAFTMATRPVSESSENSNILMGPVSKKPRHEAERSNVRGWCGSHCEKTSLRTMLPTFRSKVPRW